MRLIKELVIMALCIGFGIIIHGSVQAWKESYGEPKQPEVITEYVYIESEPEVVVEYVYLPSTEDSFRNFTTKEEWCLCDLGMREAENQGVIGQCWVMYCGLCRCEAYGQSIEEMWESKAFASSMCRSGKTPNEDCLKALELIRAGWTPKPLWFRAGHYHDFGNPLCQVGNHCFSMK